MNSIAFALRGHIQTLRLSGRNDGMVEDMERAVEALEAQPIYTVVGFLGGMFDNHLFITDGNGKRKPCYVRS
ncbi:hypothetical protein D3C87_325020 [compost metagenome]